MPTAITVTYRPGVYRHRHSARLAVIVGVGQVVASAITAQAENVRLDSLGYALLVAGPIALAFRRRAPVAVLAVASASALVYVRLPYPGGAAVVSAIIAL